MSLLVEDYPLIVLPKLAECIGLEGAIVLQQVHYWVCKSGLPREGKRWTYNSYEYWQRENFPFWSVRTVQRIFLTLEKSGLLVSKQFYTDKWNRVKWYAIDYEVVYALRAPLQNPPIEMPADAVSVQRANLARSIVPKMDVHSANLARTIYSTETTETKEDIYVEKQVSRRCDPGIKEKAREVLAFLNSKAKRNYRPVEANLELIVARLRSGVEVQDFKSVIAKKCREWLGDARMSLYLRPATLFNKTKFEQYLGELIQDQGEAK